jgi:hypothetical protein
MPEEFEEIQEEHNAKEISRFTRPISDEEFEEMGLKPDDAFDMPKFKIENSMTDNQVSFNITALFKNKPSLTLPDKWTKITPLGYLIEADFRFDWTDSKVDWDDLKAGHDLLNYLKEEDPNLVNAEVSNDID